MIKIAFKGREQNPDVVNDTEILTLLENNRSRLRDLGSMVLTVCGLLLSTSFVVLFFILADAKFNITWVVPAILFATCATLTLSIVFSVLSASPQHPSAITTKIQLIDFLTTAHNREYQCITTSVIFLIASIVLFFTALVVFGIGLL